MASITDHVIKLQKLTQTNLELLQGINDAFFAKQNHLSVKVGDTFYAIPSFICLENKLNSLTANFENLVNAPESGEAFFNFDGNSRSIQVRSYTNTPNSLVLNPVSTFDVEHNNIFKDFMTPIPHIKLGVQELPNDIVNVLVKKVIPVHNDLKNLFVSHLKNEDSSHTSIQYSYKDLYKVLINYKKGEDYIEYDKKIALPIRKNIGSGIYVIEEVIGDEIDENLDNYITIKLRSDMKDSIYMNSLKYRLFDETIENALKVGDQLTTYDGTAKVEIVETRNNTNTLVVKVLYGEYLNLVPATTNDPKYISNLSKLKFFSPIDFDNDKYVKVPLEEDEYVFIAIAALNDRMSIQSPWGSGLIVNCDALKNTNKIEQSFRDYYNTNVKNVGDILADITSMVGSPLSQLNETEFNELVSFKPILNQEDLAVVQINSHLNDSATIKNIRSLYTQKKSLQSELDQIQDEINTINETILSVSFDDTTGIRTAYMNQLTSLNNRRNDLSTSIAKILNDISVAANNSEFPIENAKYRIRGHYNFENNNHIKGIRVQYRYKNPNSNEQPTKIIGTNDGIFGWVEMTNIDRDLVPEYKDGFKFKLQSDNTKESDPSFNQIEIPISQGEEVEIRMRVVYDYGSPFVQTMSDWSEIIKIGFPTEFLRDVQVMDIINENNKDIESNKFNNILRDSGITVHIEDKLVDQDITYFHKPENIASGFYTQERRVIPLKDKLVDLNAAITELKNEILGTASSSLTVSIKHGETKIGLIPNQIQNIYVEQFSTFESDNIDSKFEGLYEISRFSDKKYNYVSTCLNISIMNNSDNIIKLFSMFPGNSMMKLGFINNYKYNKNEYCKIIKDENDELLRTYYGVWFKHPEHTDDTDGTLNNKKIYSQQGGNQFLYFRINSVDGSESFYGEVNSDISKTLSWDDKYINFDRSLGLGNLKDNSSLYLYPSLSHRYNLTADSENGGSYITLYPGDEILIPIIAEYRLEENGSRHASSTYRTMSFDLLPSLYKDPITYTFRVHAKYNDTVQDKLTNSNKANFRKWWDGSQVKYNSKIK